MKTRTLKWVLLAVLGFVGGYCVLLTLCASVSFMKAGRLWVREWTEPPIPVEEPVTLRIQHTIGAIHLSSDGRRVHGKGSLELDAGPSPALLLVLETDTGTIDVRWQGATVHGETSEGR